MAQASAQCHLVLDGGRPRPRSAPWPTMPIWSKTRQAGPGGPARVRGPAVRILFKVTLSFSLQRRLEPACLLLILALSACARHYPVQGLVIRVDLEQRTMLVSHRAIKGYMPGMTMSFHVAPKENLAKLTPGSRIDFELRVDKHTSVAHKLKPRVTRLEGINGEEIKVPPPANKIAIGEKLPDFTLTDQSGRAVRLSDFVGRVIAIDFIYTRCPLPDVCPRLSANFAYLAKHLRGRDLALLSITIDPAYDRPTVLAEYARRWQADGENWRFLTGPTDDVAKVAGLFGLVYWPEEGSITHTAMTAVIGRDGRLVALVEGSSYRAEQLRDLVEQTLGPS